MTAILSLLPLALMFAVYAVFMKLAARLYRKTSLSWKHAIVFSVLAIVLGVAASFLVKVLGGTVVLPVAVILGLALQLALGGWYLGTRARSSSGEPIAFKGGVLLALIAYALLASIGVVAAILIPLFQRASQA
jgi:putative Mn2+ efflux pump MntP